MKAASAAGAPACATPMMTAERARPCRCGAVHEAEDFARLPRVELLDTAQIAPLVVRWPEDTVVEVRTCPRCAAPIARLARRRPPPGGLSA